MSARPFAEKHPHGSVVQQFESGNLSDLDTTLAMCPFGRLKCSIGSGLDLGVDYPVQDLQSIPVFMTSQKLPIKDRCLIFLFFTMAYFQLIHQGAQLANNLHRCQT